MSSSSSSATISHTYTSLLSTLHERSALLSSTNTKVGSTIPPSLNRTLKRQLDSFAKAVEAGGNSQSVKEWNDIKSKWSRIENSLEDDTQGRGVLLSFKDEHPDFIQRLSQEASIQQDNTQNNNTRSATSSDEPYRDNVESDQEDNQEIFDSQQQMFTSQDRQLDTLSQSIGRQHHLSLQMNEELELQSDLLDNLDDDVERSGLRLGKASDQLERVKRGLKDHASLFSLFMLIMLLIALIIVFK
ncbi:unnamed protein product [Sympodiomycopsis kandeliae]